MSQTSKPFNPLLGPSPNFESEIQSLIDTCIARLANPLFLDKKQVGKLRRKIKSLRLRRERMRKEQQELEQAPRNNEIAQVRDDVLKTKDQNRKIWAKPRNGGFKKERKPSPSGKNRGAFYTDRSKIRKPGS